MKNILIAVIVLGIGAFAFSALSDAPQSGSLPAAAFLTQYQATPEAVLVDVRTPGEFQSGHIREAANIDFDGAAFEAEIGKLDKTKTYFVYCRSGNRSGQAITLMRSAGIEHIYELEGGIVANQGAVSLVTETAVAR